MLQKVYRTSMKTNSKKIPHPSSERKVSPIIGRGVRDAQTSRKKRMLVEEDYGQDFKNDLVSDSEDYGGSVMQSLHKRITPQKSPNTIGASVPPPIPNKAPLHETAGVSFPTSGDSQGKHTDTDPVGSIPQPVYSSSSDSVQPPPQVSPSRKSNGSQMHSTVPSFSEEWTSSPQSVEQHEEKRAFSRHAIVVAHLQNIFAKHPRILAAAAVFTLLLTGFLFGRLQSGSSAEEGESARANPSQQLVKELNEALALIESGQSSEALQQIEVLSAKHPDVSSLDYLAALTAMQSGDLKTAQEKAALSIAKNQKVSDSFVLLSMTEPGADTGGKSSLRDPKVVRESLLREAVNADVANPFPMIELASFLRGQKRDDEALELLRAANARMHPIDTHVVVQTSIQLMKLQQMPDNELPAASSEGSITEIFSSVYISLRKKDYDQAAIALEKGRHQASPDLFAYLINDPVFKPFKAETVMARVL
jgi:tetratricopeptide (TPR) repeat protein